MNKPRKAKRTSLNALAKSFAAVLKGIFFTNSNEDFKRLKNFIC